MNKQQIAEILAKPYAQQLLDGPEPARFAYDGLDGDPRVVPIGFWVEGEPGRLRPVEELLRVRLGEDLEIGRASCRERV